MKRAAPRGGRAQRPAPIEVAWSTRRRPLDDRAVRQVARAALDFGKRPGAALSIVFVGDRELARMHGEWLGDAAPTDVITFDLAAESGERRREPRERLRAAGPAGELYVSVERAVHEARRRRVRVERELALYVVHGVLHLCGHEDRTARGRRAMRVAERRVLESQGFEDDPTPFE